MNREPYELDPKMFAGALPTYANVRSVRVAGGLGTIARIVSEREEIYDRPLPVDTALARIDRVYKPYHRVLQATGRSRPTPPSVWRCSSTVTRCPRPCAAACRPARAPTSCSATATAPAAPRELTDLSAQILTRRGYGVTRNKPYAGGFITEHYGQPARGHARHADRGQSQPLHG